ncbi:hypothetical protein BsWGS_16120 [Bradybaena similaris]
MEPTAYEHTTETRAEPSPIRPHPAYAKSVDGLLKVAEVVLCIFILICASIDYWYHLGGGWVDFVAGSALVVTIILYIFHFFNFFPHLVGPWGFIEFIVYCVYDVLFVIAAIVSAVRASLAASIGVTAFFAFAAVAVYLVNTFFVYRAWQTPVIMTTTTTTTVTGYETKTQY